MKKTLYFSTLVALCLCLTPQTYAQKGKRKPSKPAIQDTTAKVAPDTMPKPPPEPIPIRQRRVAVLPFENSTAFSQIASQAEGELTAQFVNSGRFEVVERGQLEKILKEQALGMTGAVDPAAAANVGKLLGAKYVVLGRVTQASSTRAGTTDNKPFYRGVANVDVRFVNTESGVVILSRVGRGENNPGLLSSLIGGDSIETVTGAVTIAIKDVMKAVENTIPIEGYIVAAKDSAHVTLDIGKSGGLKKGMKLKVYREGEPIKHPVTGQMLPGVKEWLADVEVTFADETTSEVKVIQWLIKPAKALLIGDKFRSPEK